MVKARGHDHSLGAPGGGADFRAPLVRTVLALLLALGPGGVGLAIDRVRVETGVDQAVAALGVSGAGVIVAILDRGIDWESNDFRNDDGTTRIAYIFDLSDDAGAGDVDNPYGRGTIYTRQQIDRALAGGAPLATGDAVGHGTTTTGIAAGNGRNSPDRKYRGVAPDATIIAVKVVAGAPAHGNEPAEPVFFDGAAIPVAIDFVVDKARELSMPVVMLLNLGSIGGPTDGTSALARKIDETVGPDHPGVVFVTGTGDDGVPSKTQNRAAGDLPNGGTLDLRFALDNGAGDLEVWYDQNEEFSVSIDTPMGMLGPYPDSQWGTVAAGVHVYSGPDGGHYGSTNGKRLLFIRFDGPSGTGDYILRLDRVAGSIRSGVRFDASLNTPFGESGRFLNHVTPGSIWDGATAFRNVAPNSYVIRTEWTDIDGVERRLVDEGDVGELWTGSSVGPTVDGRIGVDVSAPGDRVVATYAPGSHWASLRYLLIDDGGGLYGLAGAVSAAAPVVTGIVALMLEVDPTLDAASVKRVLQETARTDGFTGQTPNTLWGHGKVDAFAALMAVRRESMVEPPFQGTAFVSADIITTADPSGLTGVAYTGRGDRTIWDYRVLDWVTVNAYLFEARIRGRSIEFQVNPEFGSVGAARAEVDIYAPALGRLPAVLVSRVEKVHVNAGDPAHPDAANRVRLGGRVSKVFGGNWFDRSVTIHTGYGQRLLRDGFLEEVLFHEGAHVSLQNHQDALGWRAAQEADSKYISDYARDFPDREDVAESVLPYFAVRYRPDRYSSGQRAAVVETIPNRLEYFDGLALDWSPYTLAVSSSNQPPVAVGTLVDVRLPELGATRDVDVSRAFDEPDGDPLTYAVSSSSPDVVTVTAVGARVVLMAVGEGRAEVRVTATDPGGLSATQVFTVTVSSPANRPPEPVGVVAPVRLRVDEALVGIEVSGAFRDPDGDALTYGVTSSAPGVAAVSLSASTVTVTPVSAGAATVTVTATDPGGLSATQAFTVTVTGPFADDPIVPGVTPVRAVHFSELRTRIDALRNTAGLGRFSWTDPVLRAGVTRVRSVHLLELRTALTEAYAAAGRSAPRWTDAAGRIPIRSVHLTELRAAVIALE